MACRWPRMVAYGIFAVVAGGGLFTRLRRILTTIPLHYGLSLSYTLIFVTIVLLFGVFFTLTGSRSMELAARMAAQVRAETLAATLSEAVQLERNAGLRARVETLSASMIAQDDAAAARELLSFHAFGDNGYVFALDESGTVVFHPDVSLVGTRPEEAVIDRILQAGSGFLSYRWRHPWERSSDPKTAFVDYVAHYGWYVVATSYLGSGVARLPGSTIQTLLERFQSGQTRAAALRLSEEASETTRAALVLGVSSGWSLYRDEVAAVESTAQVMGGMVRAIPDARERRFRLRLAPRFRHVAAATLDSPDLEVVIVHESRSLSRLFGRFADALLISMALAFLVVLAVSRMIARVVTLPIANLSLHLRRRIDDEIGGETPHTRGPRRGEHLRFLILSQLRTLVRLDYERANRREAEEQLQIAERVFENTTEGIVVTDREGCILRVNPAFEQITGYTSPEILGKNPRILRSGRHDEAFYEDMWRQLGSHGAWAGEIWNRRKSGDVYPELLSIRSLGTDGDLRGYVAVFHDISDIKATQDRLHHMATHDPLTGLPNRTYLNDMLDHTLRQARRDGSMTALIFVDLDNFKDVNDSFGHRVGDELLLTLAGRLQSQLRDEDVVARFGGDEFVVVLPRVSSVEGVAHIAQRLLSIVRQPVLADASQISPTLSMGIAVSREGQETPDELQRYGDAAMYAAKQSGKDSYRFHDPEMNASAQRRIAMEGEIHHALENDELQIVFQPIMSMTSGQICASETLVRWNRNGHTVRPGEFLPYLEHNEMITRVDFWVLNQACRSLAAARQQGDLPEDYYVTVNAGAFSVGRKDYATRVIGIVEHAGLHPRDVRIEVTETAAIRSFERARATIGELRSAGIRVCLDDFGSGNASIRYLREFGVDVVKLDRDYLKDVANSSSARSLVTGFVELTHGLGLEAVVEGVESREQLSFLQQLGCEMAQGYHIGRPAPDLLSSATPIG